jgi:hypothetical protein
MTFQFRQLALFGGFIFNVILSTRDTLDPRTEEKHPTRTPTSAGIGGSG